MKTAKEEKHFWQRAKKLLRYFYLGPYFDSFKAVKAVEICKEIKILREGRNIRSGG